MEENNSINKKLNLIFTKIKKLNGYNHNISDLVSKSNEIENSIMSSAIGNLNSFSTSALTAEDKLLYDTLFQSLSSFENEIDEILNLYSLFEIYHEIDKKLTPKISDRTLNDSVEKLLNSVFNYALLLKSGFKGNDKVNEAFNVVYKAIKLEFQKNGSSTLYNQLRVLDLTDKITEFINEDVKNYSDIRIINEVYVDYNKGQKEKEEKLLLLISLHDNNYKDIILSNRIGLKNQGKQVTSTIEDCDRKIEVCNMHISDNKDKVKSSRIDSAKRILTFALSFSILAGGIIGGYALGKPKKKIYTRLEKQCVDTVVGEYTTTAYSESGEYYKVIKVYSPINEDGTRSLKVYQITEDKENIEDYLTMELSEDNLISTNDKLKSDIANNKSSDEYKSVEIVTNVDIEKTIEKTTSAWLIALYELIVAIVWGVMEWILYDNSEYGTINFLFDYGYEELFDDLREIRNLKEKIKAELEKRNNEVAFKEESQTKLAEIISKDEEIENKYKLYFESINFDEEARKLIKNN